VILKSLFHLDRDLEVEGPDPILLGRLRGRVDDPYPKEMYNTIIDVMSLKDDTSGTRAFAALCSRDVLR
jgi:hypothetical protein